MLRRIWPALLALLVSCASLTLRPKPIAPPLTVCRLDVAGARLVCASDPAGTTFLQPLELSDKYVCMSPADAESYFGYCSQK